MFYEIFFGIVFGVIISVSIASGIHYLAWYVFGKKHFEAMEKRHREHRKRVEKRLEG